ncbi:integrase [Methylopila capsulata]|uniref:Integrase n=1 Tax=Methylopila capsulata TaxID=61654 RepID=A0ABS2T681_9HYPH|nr:site-specific integrase [Methylopila capsulata]MBM7850855.1 integrase [Methylopila capsulata]
MADTRHLKQRRQTWYFVMRVPSDVVHTIGRREVVTSLQTRDLSVAKRVRWQHAADWTAKFEVARGQRQWTPAEIEAKAAAEFREHLRHLEDVQETRDNLGLFIELETERHHAGAFSDEAYALSRARMAAARARLEALDGRPSESPSTFGRNAIDRVTLRPIYEPAKTRGMGFREAADAFLAEAQRDKSAKLTAQTIGQYEATFRLFDDWAERPGLGSVSRSKAADFLAAASKLSPTWGRSPETKARTFAQIAEKFGGVEKGLSNRTLNRYATALSQVWKWAEKSGRFEGKNPWEGQSFREAQRRDTAKFPFKPDEMTKLLGSIPIRTARALTTDETLVWVCWIAAYSGMRLNEICDRRTADLREEQGVWVFDITGAKTEAGDRRVPVHSKLIELGLLEYAKHGDEWLFSALKPGGPDGKRSWYLSKRFTAYRRGLKVQRIDPKTGADRIDFHSFRRSVVACLENQHVPQSEVAQLVGHERKGITFSIYSVEGLKLPELAALVERISYAM